MSSKLWIAAGRCHGLALRTDSSIVAWGDDTFGQCDVPAPNADFVAVGAGGWHSLGLKADGSIVASGRNGDGQCNVPAPNADFVAVAQEVMMANVPADLADQVERIWLAGWYAGRIRGIVAAWDIEAARLADKAATLRARYLRLVEEKSKR